LEYNLQYWDIKKELEDLLKDIESTENRISILNSAEIKYLMNLVLLQEYLFNLLIPILV
jgi:hypothetical protein